MFKFDFDYKGFVLDTVYLDLIFDGVIYEFLFFSPKNKRFGKLDLMNRELSQILKGRFFDFVDKYLTKPLV